MLSQPALADEELGWQKGDVVAATGVAFLLFDTSAEIKLSGNVVPGASATVANNSLLSGTIEYFPTRNFSLALIGGIPPETRVKGTGPLAPLGETGRVRYGIASFVGRYHLNASGRLSPYLGAGVSRFLVFDTKDGSATDLHAGGAWAPVMQGGLDYHMSRHIGLFANATYIPLTVHARGTVLNQPMTARAKLKTTVLKGGLFYRF